MLIRMVIDVSTWRNSTRSAQHSSHRLATRSCERRSISSTVITTEELHAVFVVIGDEQCTLEDCRRMISGVDKIRDGFVCFRDFTRMMEQQR
ncbi:putative calcium-binding protein CML36 [Camellia lanceoleosa]|uniref:Calcium-binding protein CML36 n=1 Tax=Camellia lanceoleosa TaxID=1840588 RepID=A0ACC0IF80_9ERIC|nr:putative calcium-binding protein CML36 [Camellia lanceoleosa]